jgi:pyruvate dehydrogenase E1 component alpha subunit
LSLLLCPEDYAFSHHRSHGYFLAKNAPMKSLFAEIYGRTTGANGGLAGSQDISLPSSNFYSGAILAGAIAISVGAALGSSLKNKPSVTVAGFGEAASEEGIFTETINLAAIRKLPIVFVCENNRYSVHSHHLKRQPADNLCERVAAFGIESRALFGNDVIAVHAALAEALTYARDEHGPFFIEAYTYRWHGHVGPEDDDVLGYRPQSELEFWKANCPIVLLEEQMAASGLLVPGAKEEIISAIDAEIADAFSFAKGSPFPGSSDWHDLNYSTSSPLADRLLVDVESAEFDQNQEMTIPRPY